MTKTGQAEEFQADTDLLSDAEDREGETEKQYDHFFFLNRVEKFTDLSTAQNVRNLGVEG